MLSGIGLPRVTVNVPADVTRETVGFAKRILGPLAEIGDLFSDKVRFLRFKSAAKTLNRAAEIAKMKGIAPTEIPIKFLVPFLEDCSLEEEDSPLIEQWASLLASASKGFDPLHIAIKDVLKNISSKEAGLLESLGTTIDPKMFTDGASSYQIVDHVDVNIRGLIWNYSHEFKLAMPDSYIDEMFSEMTETLPVLPIFYHIPFSPGVTRVVDTNFSTDDKGSVFLLERLEVLKSQEARFKLSEDPQISELVISYAKLTAFGVEVFRECAGPPVGKKNRQRRKKRS